MKIVQDNAKLVQANVILKDKLDQSVKDIRAQEQALAAAAADAEVTATLAGPHFFRSSCGARPSAPCHSDRIAVEKLTDCSADTERSRGRFYPALAPTRMSSIPTADTDVLGEVCNEAKHTDLEVLSSSRRRENGGHLTRNAICGKERMWRKRVCTPFSCVFCVCVPGGMLVALQDDSDLHPWIHKPLEPELQYHLKSPKMKIIRGFSTADRDG